MGRFLQPDPDAGDANTVGGYRAVHDRPAAFEGNDGASYSVEVMVDDTGDVGAPYGGYLLFVRWRHGDPVTAGHLETDYLVRSTDEATVRAKLGGMPLQEARRLLDALVDRAAPPSRPWYEAMDDA